jgi:hypothetical protein
MKDQWYTEKYGQTDTKAQWRKLLPNFAAVRSLILESRRAAKGDIIRVLAPDNASNGDLDALEALGARRF